MAYDPLSENEIVVQVQPTELPIVGGALQRVPVDLSGSGYIDDLDVNGVPGGAPVHALSFTTTVLSYNATSRRISIASGSAPNNFAAMAVGGTVELAGNASQPGKYTILEVSALYVVVLESLTTATDVGLSVIVNYDSRKLFSPGIEKPLTFTRDLRGPLFTGGVSINVGTIDIANSDEFFNDLPAHDWLGAPLKVYAGRKGHGYVPPGLTEVHTGRASDLIKTIDRLSVVVRDNRLTFRKNLQETKYKGFAACIRPDGASFYAGATMTCPANSITLAARVRRTSNITTRQVIGGWRNGAGAAGVRILDIAPTGAGTANRIRIAMQDNAATTREVTMSFDMVLNEWYDVVGTLDTVTETLTLIVNGVHNGQVSTAGSAWTTVLSNFEIGRLGGSASNFMTADVDEFRIWDISFTQASYAEFYDRPLRGDETGLIHYYRFDEAGGLAATDSVSGGNNLTLNGTFTWIGTLEGERSLYGVLKPIGLGVKRQIEPILVDAQHLVYQYTDPTIHYLVGGAEVYPTAVKDMGDAYTLVAGSDIWAATLGPAEYMYNSTLGCIRIGSQPQGTLTLDFSTSGISTDAASLHVFTIQTMAEMVVTFDVGAYNDLTAEAPGEIGFYYVEPVSFDAVLDKLMSDIGAFWDIDQFDVVYVGRIAPIAANIATPDHSFDFDIDVVQSSYENRLLSVRAKDVRVGYRQYVRPLTGTDAAGMFSPTERDDLGKEYRYKIYPNYLSPADIALLPEEARTLEVTTGYDSEADAEEEARRLYDDCFSVDLRGTTLTLNTLPTFGIRIGQVIEISNLPLPASRIAQFTVVGTLRTLGAVNTAPTIRLTLVSI